MSQEQKGTPEPRLAQLSEVDAVASAFVGEAAALRSFHPSHAVHEPGRTAGDEVVVLSGRGAQNTRAASPRVATRTACPAS